MLNIKFIRENPEKVKEGCKKKRVKVNIVDKVLALDKEIRKLIKKRDELRRIHIRGTSTEVAAVIKKISGPGPAYIEEIKTKGKREKEKIRNYENRITKFKKEFNDRMLQIPNLPLDDVPVGKDEEENVVIKEWGKKTKFDFKPKDYLEIAENLDLIDIKRAAKVSGTRFGFLKKEAALLEFAIINFAFDFLTKKGFTPVIPPVMIKPDMMKGMGYLEKGGEEVYFIERDNLYLIGTAEQVIGPMRANEIFDENELPKRYIGFSSCFRREAGAYGKDTRGIFRVHQFDKAEMFSFCHPERSKEEHLFFLQIEEKLMQLLKIPYRVVQMCTGDLGDPAAAKYDIEAWFPSENRYRETHSTSNCTDFQARRLNIKYRDSKTKKLEFVHTINGTAFSQRPIIAIIENYQQKDRSIKIPQVLQKYLPFKIIKR